MYIEICYEITECRIANESLEPHGLHHFLATKLHGLKKGKYHVSSLFFHDRIIIICDQILNTVFSFRPSRMAATLNMFNRGDRFE